MRIQLALLASLLIAADQPPSEMGSLQPQVQTALNRGALLYVYDQAAWHGTDDLRDKFPEQLKLRVKI